jgi:hypothetical protein
MELASVFAVGRVSSLLPLTSQAIWNCHASIMLALAGVTS